MLSTVINSLAVRVGLLCPGRMSRRELWTLFVQLSRTVIYSSRTGLCRLYAIEQQSVEVSRKYSDFPVIFGERKNGERDMRELLFLSSSVKN